MIALFVYLLGLACWLGGIIFFSFITAPSIFTSQIPLPEAGKVLSTIFPRYYLFGYIAGAVALALAIYFWAVRSARTPWALTAIFLAVAMALCLYAGMVVRPRVDAIRGVTEEANPDLAKRAEFDRLHALSVRLNGGMLLLNLAALVTTAKALTSRGGF
jgi:uncharacterized membrane protein